MSPESVDPAAPMFAQDVVAAAASGADAIKQAWQNPGPGRAAHYKAKRDLFQNWPTLALAIERLIGED